jgi:hypothetical protein
MSGGRWTALLMAVVFAVSTPVMAAGGSGSGEDGDEGDTMTWVSFGLVVVVGGLLFLDVLAGPDGTSLEPDSAYIQSIEALDTGIAWDSIFPPDSADLRVGISVFRTGEGMEISRDLIDQLTLHAPDWMSVYPDAVDLGSGTATETAALAWKYLGIDLLVVGAPAGGEDFLLLQAATPDSVILSTELYPDGPLSDLSTMIIGAAGILIGTR